MRKDVPSRTQADLFGDQLSHRIRAERERREISVRELARRLNISPSAISQIETGRARPSVSTLYAIVSELGMSLDDLFAGGPGREARERPPDDGVVRPPEDGASAAAADGRGLVDPREDAAASSITAGDARLSVVRAAGRQKLDLESGVRWERLTADHDPELDFLFVRYEIGGASSPNELMMRHSGREYGIVLRGELEVTVGFDAVLLGPGDSISFESTMPHRLRTVGDVPVEAIWLVRGRGGSDRRAVPPPPGG